MKIASYIVPRNDNDGNPRPDVLERALKRTAQVFGGFTAFDGRGGWVSPSGKLYSEPVTIVQVAMDDTIPNIADLATIAIHAGQELEQESVFYTRPDGTARIVYLRTNDIALEETT